MNNLVFLILITILITGCQNITAFKDRVVDGRNTEYEIRMDRSDINSLERSLAANIYPMDTRLSRILRSLSVRDSYPPVEWSQRIMTEFPWLNGITVMDKDGQILSMYPETGIKQLSYEPIFPQATSLGQGRVMLAIEHSPLGSEILLVSSVYEDFNLTGMIVVNFDPRTFISHSTDPDEIILISDQEVVWTGKYQDVTPYLEEIDWDQMVSRRVSGKVKLGPDSFFWFARAVGEDWLIYLTQDR